jgi:THO complex subunit 4
VQLIYGPNGQSRGVATVTFGQAGSAAKAAKDLNGVTIDNRPIKVRHYNSYN